MADQRIRIKSSTTAIARLERLGIVVIKCSFIVRLKVIISVLGRSNRSIEVLGRLWTRFALIRWLLLLLDIPFFLARLQVNLQACRAVFSSANVAH